MSKSRELGWNLRRFELMHDCGHLIYGRRPPREKKPAKITITVDESGARMTHTMGSDEAAVEVLDNIIEVMKRRH